MAENTKAKTEETQETSTTTNRVVTFDNDVLKKLELLSKTTGLSISEIIFVLASNPAPDSLAHFSQAIADKAKRQTEALESLFK